MVPKGICQLCTVIKKFLLCLQQQQQQQQQQQPPQPQWMIEAGPPPPPPVVSSGAMTPGPPPPPLRAEMWHDHPPHQGEPPLYSSRLAMNGSQPCLMIPEISAHADGTHDHLFDHYYPGQLLFDAQCGNGKEL